MSSTRTGEPTRAPLLSIRDLHVTFSGNAGDVHAVRGVDVDVPRGAIVGLVGESGSGKSATALSVLRLLHSRGRVTRGTIEFDGSDLLALSRSRMQALRGRRLSLVPQDPMSALNPGLKIGAQLEIVIRAHKRVPGSATRAEALRLLELVRLPNPDAALGKYPHELSGGQRQRIVIALALVGGADFLIADEATTALDATTQRRILELLSELRRSAGLSMLLITHDFGVVDAVCDEVYVMKKGLVVESGPVASVFTDPQDAYTASLLSFIPDPAKRGTPLGSDGDRKGPQ